MELIDKAAVLKILENLLEQALEVEACVGATPTAEEALVWAESEVKALPDLSSRAGGQ